MTLPASGPISLYDVNIELGVSGTATRSLNDSTTRTLFGVGSGTISLSNGYGKANEWFGTITGHQQQMTLSSWASANGWNGSAKAIITINSGVYIWSDDTSVAALTTGSFPGGLTIINNGYVMGKGGKGGGIIGGSNYPSTAGGNAISLSQSCSINNAGYIGGGGGGGGHGTYFYPAGPWPAPWAIYTCAGGGGAGGGPGGDYYHYFEGDIETAAGGVGGTIGSSGASPVNWGAAGGGGGRIFPSTQTNGPSSTYTTKGNGGSGGGSGAIYCYSLTTAGAGGGDNQAGGNGSGTGTSYCGSGGGGGWGQPGGYVYIGSYFTGYSPSAGGKAIALNGYSVTWLSGTSQVYGAVS
jgi:hypothetical protein